MRRKQTKRQKGSGYQAPASREGKRFLGGYYDPEVAKELKIIAARDDSSIQDVVGKAIELFFRSKGIQRKVVGDHG